MRKLTRQEIIIILGIVAYIITTILLWQYFMHKPLPENLPGPSRGNEAYGNLLMFVFWDFFAAICLLIAVVVFRKRIAQPLIGIGVVPFVLFGTLVIIILMAMFG